MSFDELNVQDAVISKVESVAIVSVAELKMSSTHSVVSFICGSNEAILVFLTRDFKIRQLEFYDPNSLLHCIIWHSNKSFYFKTRR